MLLALRGACLLITVSCVLAYRLAVLDMSCRHTGQASSPTKWKQQSASWSTLLWLTCPSGAIPLRQAHNSTVCACIRFADCARVICT